MVLIDRLWKTKIIEKTLFRVTLVSLHNRAQLPELVVQCFRENNEHTYLITMHPALSPEKKSNIRPSL